MLGIILKADKYPFTHVHPWAIELLNWLKVEGAVND